MRQHTSLAIGGPAEIFIIPAGTDGLIRCLDLLGEREVPLRILGGGTNLLVDDRGLRGAVINPSWRREELAVRGNRVTAPSGLPLAYLIRAAAAAGLAGLEFLAGIPGTVGGAVVMNAGWGGEEISGVIRKVRVYRPGSGEVELERDGCGFGYRTSRFQGSGEVSSRSNWSFLPAIRGRWRPGRGKFSCCSTPAAGLSSRILLGIMPL